jgi:hypothetical protein
MAITIQGTRPRPRVALLGEFDLETLDRLTKLFPTSWTGKASINIEIQIDPKELDLVIIAPNFDDNPPVWIKRVHVLCFSDKIPYLPSPASQFSIELTYATFTEEYILPELPLNFERLREVDLANLSNTKRWKPIKLSNATHYYQEMYDRAEKEILEGAIVLDAHNNLPFATIFKRTETNLGVAWLPNQCFRIFPWVELICSEWSKIDNIRFPDFGDWTKNLEWMLSDEEDLAAKIDNLTIEKRKLYTEYNQQIATLQEVLLEKSAAANKGLRRLITSQGDDLVDEVSSVFKALGFIVTKMDVLIPEGSPKLEDLRIDDPDTKDWQAIVEVRGYSKSGGRTDDLARLARFARYYEKETGKNPQKRIYVVNGQIDLPPSQRQSPLISAPEDVSEFAEQDGIIIWSLDLFQAIKALKNNDPSSIRKAIVSAKGRWS